MAPKNHLRNRVMQDLFRCMPVELLRLQQALRKELKETYVGDQPLIGALYTKIDKDRSIRDAVWDRIAERDRFFEAMLTGARWGDDIPQDFNSRLVKAKYEMERRINGPYRLRIKKASIRKAPLSIRRSSRHLSNTTQDDDPMEGPAPRGAEDGNEDLMRSVEELFASLAESTAPVAPEGVADSIEVNTAPQAQPTRTEVRPSLSVSIRDAVNAATNELKAKISDLEERVAAQDMERARHEAELEEKLASRMETALAERDAEIETVKRDLAAEMEWRTV